MTDPKTLTHEQLVEIVTDIRDTLWRDLVDPCDTEKGTFLNPDKEWDIDFLTGISMILDAYGLRPNERIDDTNSPTVACPTHSCKYNLTPIVSCRCRCPTCGWECSAGHEHLIPPLQPTVGKCPACGKLYEVKESP